MSDQVSAATTRPDSPHPSAVSSTDIDHVPDAPPSPVAAIGLDTPLPEIVRQQQQQLPLSQPEPHQPVPLANEAVTAPPQITLLWPDGNDGAFQVFSPIEIGTDSVRTRFPDGIRRQHQQLPPPMALSACRRRFRSLMRCICFPVMILTTLVAICLFLLFIGLPFFLFLSGLLMVYYCCTSDPIPFRTLLRAMVGVEDWNGGAFDGVTHGEPYNVTKEDIRKGIIRRLCLGTMEWRPSAVASSTVEDKKVDGDDVVGGDLSTLPRDYPGRVHWRNEATSATCLVFSEPLGSSLSAADVESSSRSSEHSNLSSSGAGARGETTTTTAAVKIPKYLQQQDEETGEAGKDEEKSPEPADVNPGDSDAIPVETTPDSPENNGLEQTRHVDDASSVRDRGTVCDICLLEFETGEAVAWSPNPACNHAYHEECITDWLLRKPTCPSCRQNFIILPTARQSDENSLAEISMFSGDQDSNSSSSSSSSESSSFVETETADTGEEENTEQSRPRPTDGTEDTNNVPDAEVASTERIAASDEGGDVELGTTGASTSAAA